MANHSHTSPKEAYSKIESLENRATAKAEALFHELASKSGRITSEMKDYTEATTQYIRRHPVRSTIFAGIAGIILGKLLSK